MFVPHREHAYGPTRPVTGTALILYVDVRTSEDTNIWTSTACYGESFMLLGSSMESAWCEDVLGAPPWLHMTTPSRRTSQNVESQSFD
jgi:hypothetical protein